MQPAASFAQSQQQSATLLQPLVTTSLPSLEEEGCAVKKKKKKNKPKKVTANQQMMAVQQLGQGCFALSEFTPSITLQTHSLFELPCCANFFVEEQNLLRELVKGRICSEFSKLFEVFMLDLHESWQNIMTKVECCPQWVKASASVIDKAPRNEMLFLFLVILNGAHYDIKGCSNLIPSVRAFSDDLFYDLGVLHSDVKKAMEKTKTLSPGNLKQYQELDRCVFLQKKKVEFILKCIPNLDFHLKPFLLEDISLWSESYDSNCDVPEKMAKVKKMIAFANTYSQDKCMDKETQVAFKNYLCSADQIPAGNVSTSVITDFMLYYRKFSLAMATQLKISTQLENSEKPRIIENKREIFDYFLKTYPLKYLGKWVSDIHQTLCCHHSEKFNAAHMHPPEAYINRLLIMFSLTKSGSFKSSTSATPVAVDPFVKTLKNQIQKSISEFEIQFKKIFNILPISNIEHDIKASLKLQPFQLSHHLYYIYPIFNEVVKHDISRLQLDTMRQRLLNSVRDAKQKGLLSHCDPSHLKAEIQKIVLNESWQLCVYMMIMADINAFCSEPGYNDVIHLLPNDMVRWLDLTGFDAIFLEPLPAAVASEDSTVLFSCEASENPTVLVHCEALENPTMPPSCEVPQSQEKSLQPVVDGCKPQMAMPLPRKERELPPCAAVSDIKTEDKSRKSLQMPEKQDFIETVKRPIIVRLLEQMGFEYRRTGRHAIYHHPEAPGQVVVPHSVQATGTRGSIYYQAMEVLGRRDGGKED